MKDDGNYIVPLQILEQNIELLDIQLIKIMRAKLGQSFLKGFIFSLFNKSTNLTYYPDCIIQVNEVNIDKKYQYFNLEKINNNCELDIIPLQINYIVEEKKIMLTLSFCDRLEIVRYLVPEILHH